MIEKCDLICLCKVFENKELYDVELWKGIVEMGWIGMIIFEEYGGLGFGYFEFCVIVEEFGWLIVFVLFFLFVYLVMEVFLFVGLEE